MGLSRKTLSKDLTIMSSELSPSPSFMRKGAYITDMIYRSLQASPHLRVNRIKLGGSMGKGTAISDTDFDLVVFLNGVEPPFTMELMSSFNKALEESIPDYRKERINTYCLQFKVLVDGEWMKVDLLPGSNLVYDGGVESVSLPTKQGSKVRKRIAKYAEPSVYSSSLCEQTVLFFRSRPQAVVKVIKLARYWNTQLPIGSGIYINGRSYLIELVAVAAQKGRPPCSLLQGFVRLYQVATDRTHPAIHILYGVLIGGKASS